jgi:hypothetical protein
VTGQIFERVKRKIYGQANALFWQKSQKLQNAIKGFSLGKQLSNLSSFPY